jgi:F5/8 type C domain
MNWAAAAGTLALLLSAASGSRIFVDDFRDVSAWVGVPSPNVTLHLTSGEDALVAAYDFRGGAGWVGVRRALALDLPENWALSFRIRGEGAPNTLDVKLVDGTGENVWWARREGFAPSREWRTVVVRKRQVNFAWGPAGGGAIRRISALEIVLSAGEGGKGTFEVADLVLMERAPVRTNLPPPKVMRRDRTITLDFGEPRELSGLVIDWEKGRVPTTWDVETSEDGISWATLRHVARGGAERSFVRLAETETRYLRIVLPAAGFGTPRIAVKPVDWAPTPNDFLAAIAKEAPRGDFPRAFSLEQSYFTVVGVDGDGAPSLIGEDGALEPWRGSFSVEPFVFLDRALLRWSDVSAAQALEEEWLPIPTVTWRSPRLKLEVAAVASGKRGSSTLRARWRATNAGQGPLRGRLLLAVRPFQVNPPTQFLNARGGFSPVASLAWDGAALTVNGDRMIFPWPPPDAAGARAFDEGPLVPLLASGVLPRAARLQDDTGLASFVFSFDLELVPRASRDVELEFPLHPASPRPGPRRAPFDEVRREAAGAWKQRVDHVRFEVPPAARDVVDTLRANLAYILVTREGAALRPGARSYARSWIRDGALMSAALLRFGEPVATKEFLVWFASHQFADGRVPCCVDARGADPVAEHDSHGEFLFLAGEYLRLTHDVETVRALWPRLEKTVEAIDVLRRGETSSEFHGLLPASISHEGYSARPVHSFWDDFWAWKGLSDAVEIASKVGKREDAARIAHLRDAFSADVREAVSGTIARHDLDFIPGSVELHDFDPTATTIALDPCGLGSELPQRELFAMFERYLEAVRARARGGVESTYTPYEIRSVGTFLRLGRRDEALELLGLFLKDRRPPGWKQWPEVVRRDPRASGFFGDLPHTWVGSDFVRVASDLFAYVRPEDRSLVLGAGLPPSWLEGGPVGVEGLVTPWGPLTFRMRVETDRAFLSIGAGAAPPGGFAVTWPLAGAPAGAMVNGRPVPVSGREVIVREAPADVVLWR